MSLLKGPTADKHYSICDLLRSKGISPIQPAMQKLELFSWLHSKALNLGIELDLIFLAVSLK